MNQQFTNFIWRLTLLAAAAGLAGFALKHFLPEGYMPNSFYFILLFFWAVTLLVHFSLLRITRLSPRKFVSYFMLTTLVKLMIYFIAILVYVFVVKQNLLPFLLSFFILYIIFTCFEVVSILRQTR